MKLELVTVNKCTLLIRTAKDADWFCFVCYSNGNTGKRNTSDSFGSRYTNKITISCRRRIKCLVSERTNEWASKRASERMLRSIQFSGSQIFSSFFTCGRFASDSFHSICLMLWVGFNNCRLVFHAVTKMLNFSLIRLERAESVRESSNFVLVSLLSEFMELRRFDCTNYSL